MRRILLVLTFMALLAPAGARANDPSCAPPRCVEESIKIERYTFKFNVLLPPGYEESGRRYPTLYLYMGGIGGEAERMDRYGWLRYTNLVSFTASLPPGEQTIVVLPDPGFIMDSLDGTMKWETFGVRRLIPFVDEHYRTIAGGRHRAIAGLSWGGFDAAHHATRHPDTYAALGTFSGAPLHLNDPVWVGLGTAGFPAVHAACLAYGGGDDAWLCGGYNPAPGAPIGPLGTYAENEVWWRANDASELAGNLGGDSVYIGAGNGIPCDAEDVHAGQVEDGSFTYELLEPLAMPQASDFSAALTRAGVAHETELRSCGIHSWRYFWHDLMNFWPQMIEAFGRPAPDQFDFRFVEPSASTWGWTFTAEAARAPEFLTIEDASCAGLGLTGSGETTVTTAPCFAPGATIPVGGSPVTADAEGRLTFTVDLGPAHTAQQYTPAARALEAAGGYWTSRVVRFGAAEAP